MDNSQVRQSPHSYRSDTRINYIGSSSISSSFTSSDDVCHALVMSGGGSNGAWEQGVLWGFLNYGNPDDFVYDVVSGVSAGALNTSVLASWEKGKELEFVEYMSNWLNE